MEKECTRCFKDILLTEFHKCKTSKDGLQWICKPCRKAVSHKRYEIKKDRIIAYTQNYRKLHREEWLKYAAGWRKKNKENIRIKKILKSYNLTIEEFQKIFLKQEQKCAICGKRDFPPKIDHDHETGKIRGILCFNCNCALGGFKDSTDLLELAITYLRK